MALTYLIDTSVLERMGQPFVRAAVEPLTARGQVARSAICDLEVGYSARNATEWDQLMESLDVFAGVTGQRTQWVVPAGEAD